MSKDREHTDFTLTIDDKEINFRVYKPTLDDQQESNKVRNRTFYDMLSANAPLRSQVNLTLKKRGVFDENLQNEFDKLAGEIADGEKRLAEGGFSCKEARDLAIKMRQWRLEQRDLLLDISELQNMTAEGQAENMAFNYLVSACLVYNKDGKEIKYFKDLNNYLNNITDEIAIVASNKLAFLTRQIAYDADKDLPENKFLLEFDFINDDLDLINSDGKLIDENDHLVDKFGRRIDDDGKLIDVVDEVKDIEHKGFLDDDGKVVFGKSHQDKPDEPTE